MASSKPLNEPLGLQRLSELDSLEVIATRTWTGKKYEFRECSGELLFNAHQEPSGLCCSGLGFNITLLDANDVEVMKLRRPSTMCLSKVEVSLQGAVASIVRQKSTFLKPVLRINDANDEPAYKLKGIRSHQTAQFELVTMDNRPIGAITRKWRGWRKELMTTKEEFIITFPKDLEIKYKSACIGASVYIIHARRQQHRHL